MKRCVQCHGVTGDGEGPAAEWLYPKPRDYRRGKFKFTSTPFDFKPRRADLVRTLHAGVPGTSMHAFNLVTPKDIEAVVDYVLVLTHRGEVEFQLASDAEGTDQLEADTISEVNALVIDQGQDDYAT